MSVHRVTSMVGAMVMVVLAATPSAGDAQARVAGKPEKVKPGISVLLDERIGLIRGRRIGLITNQTGVDEHRRSDVELLARDPRAQKARVSLVVLFSPEHGAQGTEDRPNVANATDPTTGLVVHSLFGSQTMPPPDSLLRGVETLVVDLQDIGTRTWTFVGVMLYAVRAAARNHIPVLVLDRPNPLGGARVEGPLLDSALSNANDPAPGAAGKAYALYPVPLRHGMTMGEMALLFNSTLAIGADLTVVPVKGWKRNMWFDQTGLPWVRPSPNMPSLTSALLYSGLVAFEGTNVSVGRGTSDPFQHVGAPWLRAHEVVELLRDRLMPGVKFEEEMFTPQSPTDGKYAGRSIPGVRVVVTDRDRVSSARVGAALLWAIAKTSPDSLVVRYNFFDERLGSARVRAALLRGEDPDAVMDQELPSTVAFRDKARPFLLYR